MNEITHEKSEKKYASQECSLTVTYIVACFSQRQKYTNKTPQNEIKVKTGNL